MHEAVGAVREADEEQRPGGGGRREHLWQRLAAVSVLGPRASRRLVQNACQACAAGVVSSLHASLPSSKLVRMINMCCCDCVPLAEQCETLNAAKRRPHDQSLPLAMRVARSTDWLQDVLRNLGTISLRPPIQTQRPSHVSSRWQAGGPAPSAGRIRAKGSLEMVHRRR